MSTREAPSYTAEDSQLPSLLKCLEKMHADGLYLAAYAGGIATIIMHSDWLGSIRANPSVVIDAPPPAGLDTDTAWSGVAGPFSAWEHDHTGLVHVLWSVDRRGLTLASDREEIAAAIVASRWLAAQRANAAALAAA